MNNQQQVFDLVHKFKKDIKAFIQPDLIKEYNRVLLGIAKTADDQAVRIEQLDEVLYLIKCEEQGHDPMDSLGNIFLICEKAPE